MRMTAELQRWRSQGIDFIKDFGELKQEVEAGYSPRHQFLVLDNRNGQVEQHWRWIANQINALPYRIIVIGSCEVPREIQHTAVKVDELPPMESPDSLRKFLWQKWVQHWYGDYAIYVRWGERETSYNKIIFIPKNSDPCVEKALVYDHESNTDQEGGEGHNLYASSDFHECIDADSPLRDVFTHIGNAISSKSINTEHEVIIYRLIEASAISIAILDERIWLERERKNFGGMGTKKYSSDVTLKKVWEKRRIYLLDADKALSNFDEFIKESFQSKGDRYWEYDFLVAHQGRLEEIEKKVGHEKFNSGWEEMKKKARWVIINTGRGKPPLAEKEGLRYVEYSNLGETLLKGAKLDLAYLLFALQAEPRRGGQGQ